MRNNTLVIVKLIKPFENYKGEPKSCLGES